MEWSLARKVFKFASDCDCVNVSACWEPDSIHTAKCCCCCWPATWPMVYIFPRTARRAFLLPHSCNTRTWLGGRDGIFIVILITIIDNGDRMRSRHFAVVMFCRNGWQLYIFLNTSNYWYFGLWQCRRRQKNWVEYRELVTNTWNSKV